MRRPVPEDRHGAAVHHRRKSADSSASQYIAEADSNIDGTVSAEEAAAYKKKLLASAAEAKAHTQAKEYQKTNEVAETSDSSPLADCA